MQTLIYIIVKITRTTIERILEYIIKLLVGIDMKLLQPKTGLFFPHNYFLKKCFKITTAITNLGKLALGKTELGKMSCNRKYTSSLSFVVKFHKLFWEGILLYSTVWTI